MLLEACGAGRSGLPLQAGSSPPILGLPHPRPLLLPRAVQLASPNPGVPVRRVRPRLLTSEAGPGGQASSQWEAGLACIGSVQLCVAALTGQMGA